jgi:hypothetical protein
MLSHYTWLLNLFYWLVSQYFLSILMELDEFRMDLVGGWFNNVENVPASAVEIIEHGKGYMQ